MKKFFKYIRNFLYFSVFLFIFLSVYNIFVSEKKNIPQEFEFYYLNFLEESKSRGFDFSKKPITIEMSEMLMKTDEYHQFAYCTVFPSPVIKVSKEFWDKATPIGKEIVLYHELTHCLWFKGHSDKRILLMNFELNQNLINMYSRFKKEVLDDNFNESFYPSFSFIKEMYSNMKVVYNTSFALFFLAFILKIWKMRKHKQKVLDNSLKNL